ncbi:hypothetical protein MOP88_11500 [Sphingomonas sp. WKB10]|nr:hypothetical protein [Sphingomonas sp. WKB10]
MRDGTIEGQRLEAGQAPVEIEIDGAQGTPTGRLPVCPDRLASPVTCGSRNTPPSATLNP